MMPPPPGNLEETCAAYVAEMVERLYVEWKANGAGRFIPAQDAHITKLAFDAGATAALLDIISKVKP